MVQLLHQFLSFLYHLEVQSVLVTLVLLVLKEMLAQQDRKVTLVLLDHKVTLVKLEQQVLLDHKDKV